MTERRRCENSDNTPIHWGMPAACHAAMDTVGRHVQVTAVREGRPLLLACEAGGGSRQWGAAGYAEEQATPRSRLQAAAGYGERKCRRTADRTCFSFWSNPS